LATVEAESEGSDGAGDSASSSYDEPGSKRRRNAEDASGSDFDDDEDDYSESEPEFQGSAPEKSIDHEGEEEGEEGEEVAKNGMATSQGSLQKL
jgi:hypothetical protein